MGNKTDNRRVPIMEPMVSFAPSYRKRFLGLHRNPWNLCRVGYLHLKYPVNCSFAFLFGFYFGFQGAQNGTGRAQLSGIHAHLAHMVTNNVTSIFL